MNNDTASLLSCQTVHALLLAIEQLLGAREAPQCASDARPRATQIFDVAGDTSERPGPRLHQTRIADAIASGKPEQRPRTSVASPKSA
jgi:hypothetical protein